MPVKHLDSRLLLNTYDVTLYTNPELFWLFLLFYTVQSYNVEY